MEESVSSLLTLIKTSFTTGEQDINTYSPVVLAYVGDAVYELVVRSLLVLNANEQVQKLHKKATGYVKASTQAALILSVMDELSEDEVSIYKRARNSKQHTTPKNCDIGEYHKATGFEAVMGYLYLQGKEERMMYLINKSFENVFEKSLLKEAEE